MEKSMEKKGKIGKYMIVRYIGQGGEGCVYLAKDEDLKRPERRHCCTGGRDSQAAETSYAASHL